MLTPVPTTAAAKDEKLEMLRINIKNWRKDKGLSFRFMNASPAFTARSRNLTKNTSR